MGYLFPESFSKLLSHPQSSGLPAPPDNPVWMGSLGFCSKGVKVQVLSSLQPGTKLFSEQALTSWQKRICFAVLFIYLPTRATKVWKTGNV